MAFALLAKTGRQPPASSARVQGRKTTSGRRAIDAQLGYERLPSGSSARPPGTLPAIQAKLEVSEPNDKFEQEADSVAEKVMRSAEPNGEISHSSLRVGRECAACAKGHGSCSQCAREEKAIQRKPLSRQTASGDSQYAGTDLATKIGRIKGGGRPLPDSVRAVFEPRFGYDFGQVRIHTQPGVDSLSRTLSARAFTVGSDIVFASGQFSPGTTNGQKLIAHELTHVVQQGSGTAKLSRNAPRIGKSSAAVQRFSEDVCDKTSCKGNCADLGNDFKLAQARIDVAIAKMKQKELSPQTRTALQWLFSLEDDSKNAYIIKVLEVMREALIRADSTSDVECAQGCETAFTETPKNITPGVLQQCTAEIPCTIHLCPPYFYFGSTERATTLLHEAGHLAGLSGESYIIESQFRLLSQKEALVNADHFAVFVRALNGTLKSDLRTSIGAAGGRSLSRGGGTGWYISGMFDLTLNRPVYRIFNPVLRFSVTSYGVEGSGRDERLEDPSDKAFVASVLGGLRIGSSRGPGGWFGDVLVGGGRAFRGEESRFVFNASASFGYRWQRTEFAFGASYIRDTTAAKGYEDMFLIGASANFNFFDLIGK